ncbi:hypothetical protein AcetOrient_orf00158p (plasmid) [Acetobacter orientalis]|uniref:Uncharacterized protein n=1 Tax=Acetobacter orientalis TaxID=146474 RepID=A0A2Z5ZMG3_9PROT|nr:hypothetical protein AcetOrient_orf00158p [Acetobacter orientalis]
MIDKRTRHQSTSHGVYLKIILTYSDDVMSLVSDSCIDFYD